MPLLVLALGRPPCPTAFVVSRLVSALVILRRSISSEVSVDAYAANNAMLLNAGYHGLCLAQSRKIGDSGTRNNLGASGMTQNYYTNAIKQVEG
jgi:hypothetical protein